MYGMQGNRIGPRKAEGSCQSGRLRMVGMRKMYVVIVFPKRDKMRRKTGLSHSRMRPRGQKRVSLATDEGSRTMPRGMV